MVDKKPQQKNENTAGGDAGPVPNPIEDEIKTTASGEDDKKSASSRQNQQARGFGNTLFGDAYRNPWDDEKKQYGKLWSETTQGRVAIRAFSRGIMGAAFFAMGNRMLGNQMQGYNEHADWGKLYSAEEKATWSEILRGNPGDKIMFPILRPIAKFFDIAYGVPIRKITGHPRSTIFRSTRRFSDTNPEVGRSIGGEVTAVTFDFAMMSVGDAWGRNIANLFDPNYPKPWYKDGHIDPAGFAKAVGKSAWKIFSYNQMEDWVAALPYIYQMRWQRDFLIQRSKGVGLGLNFQTNGSAAKVTPSGQIKDWYTPEGVWDLQLRFTGYNFYTLMFRDAYNNIAHSIKNFGRPHEAGDKNQESSTPRFFRDPIFTIVDTVGGSMKYIARSFFKAFIFMTPAVPFFWLSRAPQTKRQAVFQEAETDLVVTRRPVVSAEGKPLRYWEVGPSDIVRAGELGPKRDPNLKLYLGNRELKDSHLLDPNFNIFDHPKGALDRMLNPAGRVSKGYGDAVYSAGKKVGLGRSGDRSDKKWWNFAHTYADAALAYTPYFAVKAETTIRYDNPYMDKAIDHAIDGIAQLDMKEFGQGLHEVYMNIFHPPRLNPKPEHNYALLHKDPSDDEKEKGHKGNHAGHKQGQPPAATPVPYAQAHAQQLLQPKSVPQTAAPAPIQAAVQPSPASQPSAPASAPTTAITLSGSHTARLTGQSEPQPQDKSTDPRQPTTASSNGWAAVENAKKTAADASLPPGTTIH